MKISARLSLELFFLGVKGTTVLPGHVSITLSLACLSCMYSSSSCLCSLLFPIKASCSLPLWVFRRAHSTICRRYDNNSLYTIDRLVAATRGLLQHVAVHLQSGELADLVCDGKSSKLHEMHPAAFDAFVGFTRPAVRDEQISGTIVVT
jgi:hypothetical protein